MKKKPINPRNERETMPGKPVYACVCEMRCLLQVLVIRLVEEEVGGQLFVLVTGEVGLDCLVAGETEET
jgi:hypothetical protein